MNAIVVVFLLISCFLNVDKPPQHADRINKVIRIIDDDRRRFLRQGSHRHNAQSSESHASLPGHSLIRPANTMLKSAVKFPHDDKNLVYGNLDNLGITLGKTSERAFHGGFRKQNNFLATLVKAIKKINGNEERNKKTPSLIFVKPKPKPKSKSFVGNKLAEITMEILNMLESKPPVQIPDVVKPITIQPKPFKVKTISPPVILVKQNPKPKTKPFVGNKFKEITMKALDFLGNSEPTSVQTKPNSKASIASTLQEITMKAINFLNHEHHESDQIQNKKAKPYSRNRLQDLTMKGLSLLNIKNPSISQQKSSLVPSVKGKFKEAIKALSFIDSQNLATILKLIKKLIENEHNKKTVSVILVAPKRKPKLKPSLGKKLKGISVKLLDFLGNRSPTPIRPKLSMKEKIQKMVDKEKKIQELLNNKAQIGFRTIPREDILLKERTKKIQDFLNNHIPVINAQPLKEDSLVDRTKKVKDFLNSQVPIQEGRNKLSLIEKTKSIQDFLNNKVPIFISKDALNDRNTSVQSFFNGFNLIDEAENNANEELDLVSSEEQQNYRRVGKKKRKKFRQRESKYNSRDDDDSDLSASSDYEKNPGNPFTVHKNKYIQNWMWNHFMDGDHMNINPFGPPFASLGPTGADLFFGRKWWYFNQDDYKPMG